MITKDEYGRRTAAEWPAEAPGTILVKTPPLEPFETPQERVESAKKLITEAKVPQGEFDFGAELKVLHDQQLRDMGAVDKPAQDRAPETPPSS